MAPAPSASATAADRALTSGGWASLSASPATSISLLWATESRHERTVAARQIRFDPHVVVPELPCPFLGRSALGRRQFDDHGPGPAEPPAGLPEDGFDVSQSGRSLPTGSRHQRPPRLRLHPGVQLRPL